MLAALARHTLRPPPVGAPSLPSARQAREPRQGELSDRHKVFNFRTIARPEQLHTAALVGTHCLPSWPATSLTSLQVEPVGHAPVSSQAMAQKLPSLPAETHKSPAIAPPQSAFWLHGSHRLTSRSMHKLLFTLQTCPLGQPTAQGVAHVLLPLRRKRHTPVPQSASLAQPQPALPGQAVAVSVSGASTASSASSVAASSASSASSVAASSASSVSASTSTSSVSASTSSVATSTSSASPVSCAAVSVPCASWASGATESLSVESSGFPLSELSVSVVKPSLLSPPVPSLARPSPLPALVGLGVVADEPQPKVTSRTASTANNRLKYLNFIRDTPSRLPR